MTNSRVSKKMRKNVPDRVQEGVEEEGEGEVGVDGKEEEDEVWEVEERAEEVEEVEEVEAAGGEEEEGEGEGAGIWRLKDTPQKTTFRQQLSSIQT